MKALIDKMLILVTVSIALIFAAPAAKAQYTSQLDEKAIPVGDFAGIHVDSDFEVTLSSGPCNVKVTADKMLSPYVQVYVRGRVLYITYDSKAVPKDVRNLYKGRNAPKPVFRASVTLPELSSLFIEDNVVLTSADELECRLTSEIELIDKAQIKNLSVNANAVSVSLKKNTQAALALKAATKAEVKTEGNANLKAQISANEVIANATASSEMALTCSGDNLTLATSGSSDASVAFNGTKAVAVIGGSSKVNLSGAAETLSVTGEKNSLLEAPDFDTKTADVSLNGSVKANITVSETLDATLVGGSTLYYTGAPVFKIGKIVRSTLAPYGSQSK